MTQILHRMMWTKRRRGISTTILVVIIAVIIIVAGLGVYYYAISGQPSSGGKQVIKIALILPGEKDDESWNQLGYTDFESFVQSLNASGKYVVHASVVEGAYTSEDVQPAMQSFASQGYSFIIGYGFQDQPAASTLGPQYPNIGFLIPDGYNISSNVANAEENAGQRGFAMGVLAALLTHTGKVALIGGVNVGELTWDDQGFRLGVNYTNQNFNKHVQYIVTYTGNFNDPTGGASAANAAISQGADVIYCTDGGTITEGVASAAESAHLPFLYSAFNATSLAPAYTYGGETINWTEQFQVAFNSWMTNKTFSTKPYWGQLSNSGVGIWLTPRVPSNITSIMTTIINNLRTNKLASYQILSNGTLAWEPATPAFSSLSPSGS
jgi:basic membrane protein A